MVWKTLSWVLCEGMGRISNLSPLSPMSPLPVARSVNEVPTSGLGPF